MTAEFFDVQLDVTFTAPNVVENIVSQDNISAAFGKISKWYTSFAWSAWTAPTVEVTGSGNAVTSATYGTGANENKLILTLGSTFLTQHPTIPVTTDTTSTDSPAFGSTFTAIDSITRDANGHVTTLNTKTVTIPNTTMGAATSSATGSIGLVPAPAAGEQASFLRGDGTWAIPTSSPYTAGTGLVLSGMTFNHSNSVTERTDYMQPYVKYDAQGHITGSSYWMATAKGTDGTAGWVKVATIKHKMTYDNTPFLLDVSQRGNTISYRIHIRWNNANSVDPPLGEFLIASDHAWESIRPRAYIIKSDTSTWDLYILKFDNYEAIAMKLQPGLYFSNHTEWTWKDEQTAESAITGGTEATKKIYSTTDHTHFEGDVLMNKDDTFRSSVGIPIVSAPFINTNRANKFAFMTSDNIQIEYTTDGGTTWNDGGYTAADKASLFIMRQIGDIKVGPNTSDNRTTQMQTRITLTFTDRDAFICKLYIWFSTNGHQTRLDIEYANASDPSTFIMDKENAYIDGWPGGNIVNISNLRLKTTVSKIRLTFRTTSVYTNATYINRPSAIYDIQAFGKNGLYAAANSMMGYDHLYSWDVDKNATFPAEVKVPTQLRVYNGNYGALFRTDGTNTHILLTNSGEAASGSWSALRPFSISNSTGLVTMNEGLRINTKDGAFLEIHGLTTTSYAYGSSSPKIRFTNSVSDQNAELIWDDHDTYCTPASLTLIGNQDGTFFCAPRIRLFSAPTAGSLIDIDDTNNKNFHLRYKSSLTGYTNIISVYPGTENGCGVIFNNTGGGLCIIGGGEAASSLNQTVRDASTSPYGTAWTYGTEYMVIGADSSIYFVSGANGLTTTNHTDWTHLRTAIFDANGYFKPSVNLNGSIGTAGNRWLSMYAKRYFGRLSQQVNLTRQTTANLACEGTMSMQLIQATGSMTTGKPAIDGYILDFDWDNTGPYKAQLSIPNAATGSIQWRPQAGYVNWDNAANLWRYVHDNTKGVGKTGFLAYPTAGSYYEQSTQNVTGALVITLPFAKTNGQCMIHFSVDIYNYTAGQSVTYVIAGYCYNDEKWYSCTAYALGSAMSDFNNLVVRFGCVTDGKYKIQIGETTTVWKYPQVSIRDVTVGYKRAQDQTTYAENIGNWTVTFESSNIANVTQTITYTRPFLPFDVATGSSDANTYLNRTGWFNWDTTTGSNMPTTNWGILLSKQNPSLQVFIPDNASGIYFRRRANTTATPTAWWGITGTAGTTYDLNNLSGKYALVVDETSDFASYAWHKFAEVTVTDAYADATITFLVSKTWGNSPLVTGILSAHIRTGGTKVFESAQFRWMIANGEGGIDPTKFVMVYTDTASTSCKVELWHKQTARYDGWIFKVLKEHSRVGYGEYPWTLFKHNAHGSAAYTTGTGTIVSTLNSIANTALSANKINTNAGNSNTPVYFSNGVPVVVNTAASGANFNIVPQVRNGDGVMEIGRYIDFHSTAAGTTDYDIRLDASSTSLLTMTCNSGTPSFRISGTLPRLRFTQTTSGSAYDNANCGITAYPGGNTSGVNLVIQSAGNTYIGGGESVTAMYTAIKTSGANPYTNLKRSVDSGGTASSITPAITSERMFITSDEQIFFAVGANGLSTSAYTDWTNLKTVLLDSDGFFRPSIDNKGQIGTSDYKWKAVHATDVVGNAAGKDGFIAYPEDGTFSGNDPSTPFSCITITLPIDESILTTLTENSFFKVGFKVDIWAYGQWPETSDTLTIAGLITKYDATLTWFAETALSNCYPYTVSFGSLNSKAQIQILVQHGPELYTPEIRIRDVVMSDLSGNHTTFAENKSGWIIESNSNFPAGYVESAYIANSSLTSQIGFVWNNTIYSKAVIDTAGALIAGRYIDFFTTADSTMNSIRLDGSSTEGKLTLSSYATKTQFCISGKLPRIIFTQTTSGSAYNDETCGITAYPGNTAGVNLVIQGGGNTIIGAGESPTALYTDIITTNKNPYGTTALTGGERMYITSDNEIYFVSGANGLSTSAYTDWTNLKTMIYDSSGYLKPSVNNKGSIGTSGLKWASMYATTFYGLLNGTLALGTALSSSNNIDTDTKTTTGNWYSASSSVSATIANTPVTGHGFHVFNIPTTGTNNTYQKQFLIGNTAVIPYMYRYLSNGSWSGGWRSPGTGFMYVVGTQTASTAAWTGVIPIPALYDGLTIAYYLPYASAASTNVTLNLTLSNGQTSGAINVYYTGTSRMTTHYGAGSTIILTYFSAGSISVSGTATTDARWTHSDYNTNTNTAVTQSNSTTANYRALILGYNNSTTPSDLTATVTNTVYASENLYAQPSTGLIACNGRKLITPFAIQTGSSKRQKITLQTLMTWLITTKKYIHSGIYEHVVLQTTWAYADNDILRLAVNGINYEMDLAGVRIEYIGSATSYNAGAFTLKIISNPAPSFTATSGYTKFPPSTIAFYTCNGSSYAPVWRMIMNGACGQPKIFESTDNTQVFPVPIEVTGLFTNWKVLLAQCTRLIYGGGDECSSFQVIIPLEYLKSLGTSGEMHIPLPFTIENNPIGRNYMILKYVNDNKFTIGYHNDGIDSIGGRGLWTMYGMY